MFSCYFIIGIIVFYVGISPILILVGRAIWIYLNDVNFWKDSLTHKIEDTFEWGKNLSALRIIYFIAIILTIPVFLYSLRVLFPLFLEKPDDLDTSFSDISLAVFAIFSGLGALFGFYTSIVRTEIAEQGLITDRINKATEGLGKINQKDEPVVEARLGALYALERIAKDSIRDHVEIMELLCAYIRYNSPDVENGPRLTPLREDIQAALTIIGRRENWPEGQKRIDIEGHREYKIKLNNCDLHRARLSGANLSDAEFGGSDLHGAFLDEANLSDVMFYHADMSEALICNSDISGADFGDTNMKHISTDGAYAEKCDISFAQGLSQKQLNKMFFGKSVEMPKNRKHPQKGTDYYKDYATFDDFIEAYHKWMEAQE